MNKSSERSYPSIIYGLIFCSINLILLSFLAWVALIIWFCMISNHASLLDIIVSVSKLIKVRLYLFIKGLPFLCIFLFVCIIDGLVQRDVRKYQGARESAFLFHRLKIATSFSFYIIFFITMGMPISFPTEYSLIMLTCIMGYLSKLSVQYFKKYL